MSGLHPVFFFHSHYQPQTHSWGFSTLALAFHLCSSKHLPTLSLSHTPQYSYIGETTVCLWPIKKKKELRNTAADIKKCSICSFLGSGLDFWGGGEYSRGRQRAVYEQFFILFLFSPIPPFYFFFDSPLSYSFSHPPPSLPQSPSPAGCLILSRFQHAFSLLEELQVCWWNLAEKGCESRQRLLT